MLCLLYLSTCISKNLYLVNCNEQRFEIVNGTTEIELTPEDAKMDEGQGEDKTAEKGVPSFWLTALQNNDVTSEEVSSPLVVVLVV